MSEHRPGLYLYCLTPRQAAVDLPKTGFDREHPAFMMRAGPIRAILSWVSLDDFRGPEAEVRLQDISWVGPRAMAHEQLIEKVMQVTPVFPARFGTIFSNRERLEATLRLNADLILDFFQEARDKDEFAVKGYLDLEQLKKTLGAELIRKEEQDLAALSPGKRYFAEKRIQNSAESLISSRLAPLHEDFRDFLNSHTEKSRFRSNLSKKATGRDSDMIVNAACLVQRKHGSRLQLNLKELAQRHQPSGLYFEVSGPWPQYSFCPALQALEEVTKVTKVGK